jgi:hypothetical protein
VRRVSGEDDTVVEGAGRFRARWATADAVLNTNVPSDFSATVVHVVAAL